MKYRIVSALLGIPLFFIALFVGSIILGTLNNQRSSPVNQRLSLFLILTAYGVTYFLSGFLISRVTRDQDWKIGAWVAAVPTLYILIVNFMGPISSGDVFWEIFTYTPVVALLPLASACAGALLGCRKRMRVNIKSNTQE